MGNRINIGVYIGPQDDDIAAWFNLLQDNHMSRAKWVMALFCAYAMEQRLPIGTINIHAPLIKETAGPGPGSELIFGAGSSQAEVAKRDRYGYGWQIRGPHREFIQGSVINVSISKAEILPVLEESWRNGHHLATFLKALIRDNLNYDERAIPPRMEDLQKACSAFLVSQNSKKVQNPSFIRPQKRQRQGREKPETTVSIPGLQEAAGPSDSPTNVQPDTSMERQPCSPAHQTTHPKAEVQSSPAQEQSKGAAAVSSKTFRFDVEPDAPFEQSAPDTSKDRLSKNPLLAQI